MAKNYEKMGKEIIANLGGEGNITKLFHCATRLRFDLKDKSAADLETLKNVAGVMGAVESVGGIQIIIGNDVQEAYKAIMSGHNIGGQTVENVEDSKNPAMKLLNVLAAIVGPVIPLIMCSGLISALLIILTKCGLSAESTTYQLIQMVGNGALYLLPILLAYSSAKKFGCNTMISLFLGGLMLSPTLSGLGQTGTAVTLFGLPVKAVDYSSTLIPIVLTIWAFSYVEKVVEKIVPDVIKFVFRPLLNVIIMLPVMLCVTGPIGSYCGDLLCGMLTAINNVAPWASVIVVGSLAPLLVLTGMHIALIPLVMMLFSTVGYDNVLFPAFIAMNFSQFGVAAACFFKSKKSELKTLAISCALTSFLAGVTEPTLYGICVRMKKPLLATWIACVVNAVFCAVFGIKVYSFGAPSFFTMPIFLNPDGTMTNFYFAIAAAALTIVISFAGTWILGFDDRCYEEQR